jgi:hypothetical protein
MSGRLTAKGAGRKEAAEWRKQSMTIRNSVTRLSAIALIALFAVAALPATAAPAVADDGGTTLVSLDAAWTWVSDAWHSVVAAVLGDGGETPSTAPAPGVSLDDPQLATTGDPDGGGEHGGAMDPNG